MNVEINHKEINVPRDCTTLGALLESQGIDGKGKAVAIGSRVVPRQEWDKTALEAGMKITIIRAVCGG